MRHLHPRGVRFDGHAVACPATGGAKKRRFGLIGTKVRASTRATSWPFTQKEELKRASCKFHRGQFMRNTADAATSTPCWTSLRRRNSRGPRWLCAKADPWSGRCPRPRALDLACRPHRQPGGVWRFWLRCCPAGLVAGSVWSAAGPLPASELPYCRGDAGRALVTSLTCRNKAWITRMSILRSRRPPAR